MWYVVETRNTYGHRPFAYKIEATTAAAAVQQAVYVEGKRTGLDSVDVQAVAQPYDTFVATIWPSK